MPVLPSSMLSTLSAFAAVGLIVAAAGCARTPPTLSGNDERAATEALASERDRNIELARQLDRPEPQPARKEDFLTLVEGGVPEAMRNTIEIRAYRFGLSEIEDRPEVRLNVFNRLDDKSVTFEIRTLFFREDGSVIDATRWARAVAPPRQAYRYAAITFSDHAVSEQVQVRLLAVGDENASPEREG